MVESMSFEELYDKFKPKIINYLARLTNPSEAEDIAQEVFLKVSRALKDFRGESSLSTWLYRIATNAAFDRLKTQSFKHSAEELSMDEGAECEDRDTWSGESRDSTDQKIVRKDMNECIREQVEELPPDYNAVMVLSEIEGFKNKEIADILQISLDTVKIRLHRARAKPQKIMESNCNLYHNEQSDLSCDRKASAIK